MGDWAAPEADCTVGRGTGSGQWALELSCGAFPVVGRAAPAWAEFGVGWSAVRPRGRCQWVLAGCGYDG